MSKLISAINKQNSVKNNFTSTENGALTHKSTLSGVLDFFALGGALRTRSESDVIEIFSKAYNENPLLALKALFHCRDIRNGSGERETFKRIFKWLACTDKDTAIKNLKIVSLFGRWDDLFSLVGTPLEEDVFNLVEKQFKVDLKALENGENVSLLGKWMASINASSHETVALAKKLCKHFEMDYKTYRKNLSKLRAHINVVEKNLCTKDYSSIDYEKIPSKAGMLYRKAFSKNDGPRYKSYLDSVKKGEAKINTGALYPHEIVHQMFQSCGQDLYTTLELLWKNLPDYAEGKGANVLPVVDVSESMESVAAGNTTAMEVAIALGLYFCERLSGQFRNQIVTFSEEPTFLEVKGNTTMEKLHLIKSAPWGMSTNLQSVFDQILSIAVKNNLKQEDLPSELLIISDMEHNVACKNGNQTNHEVMRTKYRNAGYDVPKIVFWNCNARNNQSPVKKDADGVKLVSGFSPSILKSILSSKEVSPYDFMLEVLNNERYDVVKM